MKKFAIFAVIGLAIFVALIIAIGGWTLGVLNNEAKLEQLVKAKQVDNQNEYDNCWKSISQTAQVSEMQAKALTDIVVKYAGARGSINGGGCMIDARQVHEVVPSLDGQMFTNLMNTISSKRDGFALRQKELLDINREHNTMFHVQPQGIVLSIFGRKETEVKIVTSARTERAFDSGKDDDVTVFSKDK